MRWPWKRHTRTPEKDPGCGSGPDRQGVVEIDVGCDVPLRDSMLLRHHGDMMLLAGESLPHRSQLLGHAQRLIDALDEPLRAALRTLLLTDHAATRFAQDGIDLVAGADHASGAVVFYRLDETDGPALAGEMRAHPRMRASRRP